MSASNFKTALTGYARYRGREGHIAFLLHRLTGLGTLLFLLIHIVDTAFVFFWPQGYAHAIALYRSTPFMLGEIVLVFSVIYHGANGLRIAWLDLFKPEGWEIERERPAVRWTLTVAIVLWLPAAIVMFSHLLQNLAG